MKKYLILCLVVCISLIWVLSSQLIKQRSRIEIANTNLIAKSAELEKYVSTLGDTISILQGLRLQYYDLKKVERDLHKEVSALKIKLKNVSSIVKIETVIRYVNRDSLIYVPITDSSRKFIIDDPWIKAQFTVTSCSYIKPGDFKIDSIPAPLLFVTETQYKRSWIFWKKPIGVQVQATSKNPYLSITTGKYIQL